MDTKKASTQNTSTAHFLRHPFHYNKFGGWADNFMCKTRSLEETFCHCELETGLESSRDRDSKTMGQAMRRHIRVWYLLPLIVNLTLVFWQILMSIDGGYTDDDRYPFCEWLLYTSVALTSPMFLVMSRLLPDPAIALCIGGCLSSGGLLWSSLTSPDTFGQKLAYGLGTGMGISLSLQAITLAVSPYFVSEGIQASSPILVFSLIVMLGSYHLPSLMAVMSGNTNILLGLSFLVFISALLPLVAYLFHSCKGKQSRENNNTNKRKVNKGEDDVPLLGETGMTSEGMSSGSKHFEVSVSQNFMQTMEEDGTEDHMLVSRGSNIQEASTACRSSHRSCLQGMGHGLKIIMEDKGWKTSCLSVLVWLTWGAGVDTTWLDIGWTQSLTMYPNTRLPSIQMVIALCLLIAKLISQNCFMRSANVKVNLASNYMFLGLMGCSGVLLCLFPECSNPLHASLLFTASLALQYDDLSDLCLIHRANCQSMSLSWPKGLSREGKPSDKSSAFSYFTRLPFSSRWLSPTIPTSSVVSNSSHVFSLHPTVASSPAQPLDSKDQVSHYAIFKVDITRENQDTYLVQEEEEEETGSISEAVCTVACLTGHGLSLLLMACLSMVLGLQVANGLIQLFMIPPFSYICSSGGLLILSSAAIAISLGKPDVWIEGKYRRFTVVS